MTPLIDARSVSLGERLRQTDVLLGSNELVALIGPNGSGKTSLLRSLAGVERADGEIAVDGQSLNSLRPERRPYILAFVPASRDLVWPISVRDVIALGLPRPDPSRVDELIDLLELGELATRRVDRLSTGERARVLLARALAPRPKLLLLDEPLSNLDPYWVLRLLEILREQTSSGTSALVALHDIDRITAFDRTILMDGGAVRADLSPEEMLSSDALADAFGIDREARGWRLRRRADPRSSP